MTSRRYRHAMVATAIFGLTALAAVLLVQVILRQLPPIWEDALAGEPLPALTNLLLGAMDGKLRFLIWLACPVATAIYGALAWLVSKRAPWLCYLLLGLGQTVLLIPIGFAWAACTIPMVKIVDSHGADMPLQSFAPPAPYHQSTSFEELHDPPP